MRRFLGSELSSAALSKATHENRSSAEKSFDRYMKVFTDFLQSPLTAAQSKICTLFAKKTFYQIFRETKGLYFAEKLILLRNFIFNSEKHQCV